MNKYNLEVSKKEGNPGKYVPVGTVTIYYPLLSDFGFDVAPKAPVIVDGKPVNQGLPVYSDDKLQFLFDSVFAAAKADARNKLVSGTVNLKDGASIATTLEELVAVAERDGSALIANRNMLTAFKAYLATTGKATATQAAILSLANKTSLKLQPAEKKEKFQAYLVNFASTLTAEQAGEFARSLQGLDEACSAVDALDDM